MDVDDTVGISLYPCGKYSIILCSTIADGDAYYNYKCRSFVRPLCTKVNSRTLCKRELLHQPFSYNFARLLFSFQLYICLYPEGFIHLFHVHLYFVQSSPIKLFSESLDFYFIIYLIISGLRLYLNLTNFFSIWFI